MDERLRFVARLEEGERMSDPADGSRHSLRDDAGGGVLWFDP
jgi:hypothetical protein